MEEKRAAEDFRLRQHAGPHPSHATSTDNTSIIPPPQFQPPIGLPMSMSMPPRPDSTRVILHFDADCFYAQCEELRDTSLRDRPLGVTQKFLIVTCNYIARGRGITKLMSIKEAMQKCPDLILINGEDLTPYRHASKHMISVLSRYGTVEKLGLDEIFVDITATVDARLQQNKFGAPGAVIEWAGHIHVPGNQGQRLQQDNKYRPMDLRATAHPAVPTTNDNNNNNGNSTGDATKSAIDPSPASTTYSNAPWWPRLATGSLIARDARHAVKIETGLRTSAGISCNKLLSKLCGGLHKPDDQTILLPCYAAAFVEPLPVRALPSVGLKLESQLLAQRLDTVGSLRKISESQLIDNYGPRVGTFLSLARWGNDISEVLQQGPPKSVTVEDSFRSCRGNAAAKQVLQVLVPDLIVRLREEEEENKRRPTKLILKWRVKGQGWNRTSASCAFPIAALTQADDLQRVAGQLLAVNIKEPFDLTLISIGGTNFVDSTSTRTGGGGGSGERSIADMLIRSGTGTNGASIANNGWTNGGVSEQIVRQQQQPPQNDVSHSISPAAVAGLSLKRRRDYGTGTDHVPLSKHAERMMRQGGARGGGSGSGSGGALVPSAAIAVNDDELGDEDLNLWDDLAGLHDSSHTRKQRTENRNGSRKHGGGAAVGVLTTTTATTATAADSDSIQPPMQRVIIHCDIDSFYCSVESLDDPSLLNVPLAVEQFNSGGFVAVSYEARAAGIRCGDGAGAAGRAAIPHLAAMKARSIEECKVACPGLVVRGMRPQRYREVGRAVHEMLKSIVGPSVPVEKASCDDFYLDVTSLCCTGHGGIQSSFTEQLKYLASLSTLGSPPDGMKFINEIDENGNDEEKKTAEKDIKNELVWSTISSDLQRGVWIAHTIRHVLSRKLRLTASCAVSRNKLISRLASPVNKPNGLTLVPSEAAAVQFIGDIPVKRVPSMQGKFGTEVQGTLHVVVVKDLVKFDKKDLEERFGENKGKFLFEIPRAVDDTPVAERGPPKSITSERSFPPAKNQETVANNLKNLIEQLLLRGAEDFAEHSPRLPIKLGVAFRLGYDTSLVSRSASVPVKVLTWLRSSIDALSFCVGAADAIDAATEAGMVLLRGVTNGRWDITRIAVVFHYSSDTDSTKLEQQSGPTISDLFQAAPPVPMFEEEKKKRMQKSIAGPSKTARKKPSAAVAASTYRNPEALALQAMFGNSSGAGGGDQKIEPLKFSRQDDDLDKASLELALKLQREEAEAMAASHRNIQTSNNKKKTARGPLDSFFLAKK